MDCANCGRSNRPEARFCVHCGSALVDRPERAAPGLLRPGSSALPPRDLGQLLGETFDIYQRNFRPLFLVALLPQVPLFLSLATPLWLSIVLWVIGIVASIIANGAIVVAVVQQYLGREVNVGECLNSAWRRVVSLLTAYVLFLLAVAAAAVLVVIIIGVPLFFYLLVSWWFAGQAILLERKRPIAALVRSRDLVRGSWWRVFGIGIVFVLVLIGLGVVIEMLATIAGFAQETLGDIVATALNAVVLPVAAIGTTLVYIDLRVRKEDYTLETMASETGPAYPSRS